MDKVFSNPDVYCVRVPFVNLGSGESNCYIVRDGGDCLVVDPGAANEVGMRRVRNALFELGVPLGECKVFLTHTHFDHAESTRVLFPEGTCVYVSEVGFEERSPIRAEAARELFVRRMLKMGATLADAEEYSRNDYEPTFLPAGAFDYRFVREGDEVHVGRFAFDVVEVPGHTLDLVCLVGRDGAPSFTGDEVIFGTTPSVDAPFDGEDALALYMEGLGLSGDGSQRLALWRSDGKRVFGASGMQSERFGEKRFFGSVGRQLHVPRGACVQEPDELQLGRVDARVQMADGAVGAGVRERDDSQPHGVDGEWLQHVHWTLPGHGEGFGGQTLRSRAADIVSRKLRHCDRMIATARECPGIGGEELARRSLTQKDVTAWRAAPSISRYYSMLEAFVGVRYLENQGKLRREEVDGTWRFYAC
ncbi:MBL fold metallo-hydrolase [Slackia isoflavoniconvertens]|uniref:MBL fold metallo-hydrolase n=1 Tax=Slackia isoflavoniconvertens TaxID=572010 RepID=UPI003AB94544